MKAECTEARSPRARLVLAAAAFALLLAPLASAQSPGAKAPRLPEATEDGTFEGTWARLDPGSRQALQFRRAPKGRTWQVRLQWRMSQGFSIDSAWQERVEYEFKGYPGSLELRVDPKRSSDDRLLVEWMRTQGGERGSRLIESGTIEAFRTGRDGWFLAWHAPKLLREVAVEQPLLPEEANVPPRTTFQLWNFEKQSFRMLEWDEIYW